MSFASIGFQVVATPKHIAKSLPRLQPLPCMQHCTRLVCGSSFLHALQTRPADQICLPESFKTHTKVLHALEHIPSAFYVPQQTRDDLVQHRKSKVTVSVKYSNNATRFCTTDPNLWQMLALNKVHPRVLHITRNVSQQLVLIAHAVLPRSF